MRTLVSIQKIIDIKPIENADAIELCTVLGWHCVSKKGEFKIGELCAYFEVDSLLPIIPEFEFLAKNGTKKSYMDGREYEGYRLRTVRLRGKISQGLCLPLAILKGKKYSTDERENPEYGFTEGMDVTSLLGVVKYEPQLPASLSGIAKGIFPSFIPKTDEPRIQAFPNILLNYQSVTFYVTEKVDGTSCSIFFKDGELNVCSRNINLLETPDNTFWKVAREYDLENKLKNLGKNIALQGELIGSNIQSDKLKLNKHKILFFNAYDWDEGKYLDYKDFTELCKELAIPTVPIITNDYLLPKTIDDLVVYATRKSLLSPEIWAEGIVLRPLTEMHDEDISRLSFKIINPEFLIKYGE